MKLIINYSSALSNLAIRIEGKGQYNIAKYIRATIDSLSRESAFKMGYATGEKDILDDMGNLIRELEQIQFDKTIIQKLSLGLEKISNNEISKADQFPEPIVCRRCGFIALISEKSDNDYCRKCGAGIDTFVIHHPIYWMREFDPIEALDILKKTPIKYSKLIQGIASRDAEIKPASGGWSIFETLKHIKDADGVLNMRVKLILDNYNPTLEFKKVWDWADKQTEKKETIETILKEYTISRADTVGILENTPLKDWWRPAVHEEFGSVTLKEQVSYFAAHELTHIRQIVSAIDNKI
jgi:uncharacterized damage-inducible protein DinB